MMDTRGFLSVEFGLAFLFVLGLGVLQLAHAQEAEIQFPITVSTDNGNSRELTLGLDPEATDSIDTELGEEEQPPVPPGFDARLIDDDIPPSGFGEGLIVDLRQGSAGFEETKMYEIAFQADPGNNVTISWDLPDGITGTIEDKSDTDVYGADMSESDSITVSPGAPDAIVQIESTTIPVELTGLEAQPAGDEVRLTWQTASETNNTGFFVQRKQRRTRWQRLGFVESNVQGGTTSEPQSYQFTDSNLPYAADTLTYRLRQVDTDGTAHVSRETVVRLGATEKLTLQSPFPNPARQQTTLHFGMPTSMGVRIAVYDLLGREVKTLVDRRLAAGRHVERLSVSPLAPGMYFVRLRAGGRIRTRKLTVVP